jgi:hypothetical protein
MLFLHSTRGKHVTCQKTDRRIMRHLCANRKEKVVSRLGQRCQGRSYKVKPERAPAVLMFLDDNRAIELQIVKLSFEFAKADATLETTAPSPHDGSTVSDPPTSDLAHFIELQNRHDHVRREAIEQVETLNKKIARAENSERQEFKAALQDAEGRLQANRLPIDGRSGDRRERKTIHSSCQYQGKTVLARTSGQRYFVIAPLPLISFIESRLGARRSLYSRCFAPDLPQGSTALLDPAQMARSHS